MLSCTRWLKVGYVLALATSVVLLLSKPAPIQAQRTIAYPFLPGALTNALQMSIVAGFSGPMNSYFAATQMIAQASIPAGLATGITPQNGIAGGIAGGLGGFGGGAMGIGGGMNGMGGMGGLGGAMGMGGMNMGGGMGGGGMGGMGGFAGKGFGGFNGKKPL